MENKTLVAYFSASGVTAKAASSLAAAIGADLYEIKPAVPYTNKDLNWQDKRSRSSMEMNESSSRPELAERNVNLAAYNRIFLGFPIWWYTAPRIIQTFLESCDFAVKTIIILLIVYKQLIAYRLKTTCFDYTIDLRKVQITQKQSRFDTFLM